MEQDISKQTGLPFTKEDFQSRFNEYSGGTGTIQSSKSMELAQELNLSPSKAECETFVKSVGESCDRDRFYEFCTKIIHPEDTMENLELLFSQYDQNGDGFLSKDQLKTIFQSFGEPLNEKEVEFLIKDVCGDESMVNYKQLIAKLANRNSEIVDFNLIH